MSIRDVRTGYSGEHASHRDAVDVYAHTVQGDVIEGPARNGHHIPLMVALAAGRSILIIGAEMSAATSP